MAHPWLKKNHVMSMWLSTAYRMAGSLRGQATAQVKRQADAAMSEATRETLKLWTPAVKPATAKAKRKR